MKTNILLITIIVAVVGMLGFAAVSEATDHDCPAGPGADVSQCWDYCIDQFDGCMDLANTPPEVHACISEFANCRSLCQACPI